MFLLIALFIFLFFIVIIIFSFPNFSPIPYYPTNHQDLPLIIKALKLRNDQTIFDLGAGDGVVIFESAKFAYLNKLNTQFVAIDINPILIFIMHLRRLLHPNRKNIKIIWADMFKINYNSLTHKPTNLLTLYLYVSPWFIEKIIENYKLNIENFSVVSYFYPIKSLIKRERIIRGKNKVYIYS